MSRIATWSRLAGALALALTLAGCGKPAFTLGVRERFQFTTEDIRRIQFFTSDEIVLRRELAAQEVAPSQQGLVVRDGSVVEEIIIPRRTPCVALRVEGDFLLVGFAPDNPAKALWFGVKNRSEATTPHEERRFELVHLENTADETPFEPRYAKGYQLTYNGFKYQIADGKMWDVHLVYEEGSNIRQRSVETPPGWKQANLGAGTRLEHTRSETREGSSAISNTILDAPGRARNHGRMTSPRLPSHRRALLLAPWLFAGLLGCDQVPIIAGKSRGGVTLIEGTVGPRGVLLKSGEVEIEIPPGAVDSDTPVSVQKIPRGGTSTASLHTTAVSLTDGCGSTKPQGAFLYAFEPQSLVFSKDVRVTIDTIGSPDGPTVLTLDGLANGVNGYGVSGGKASIRLRDFASSIDVQTLVSKSTGNFSVSCDASSCTAINGDNQSTVCADLGAHHYSCQGPTGTAGTAEATTIEELRGLIPSVAIGQGATCTAAQPPSCGDGVRNGAEACEGADLGGTDCATLLGAGATGTLACKADCTIDSSACVPPATATCGDGVRAGTEECDGADLNNKTCQDFLGSAATGTLSCDANCKLVTTGCQASAGCSDGTKDGTETDIDCGGGACAPCADTKACAAPTDCTSGVCTANQCAVPTCADTVKNGAETDTDCGGSGGGAGGACAACADGKACAAPTDCVSGVCTGGLCATPGCADTVKNGAETDIDCGGTCGACADGKVCQAPADCQSGLCVSNLCEAVTCTDKSKNGTETDVDCGGGACLPCADGLSCVAPTDCASGVCTANQCAVPTCSDTVKNGTETDTDCGGGIDGIGCAPCVDGLACAVGTDCASGVCTGGLCAAASCTDTLWNGTETDTDCGGPCAPCADGLSCVAPTDCASGVCTANQCAVPTCSDGMQNGTEIGLDCGGACQPCGSMMLFIATSASKTVLGELVPGQKPVITTDSTVGSLCDPAIVFPSDSYSAVATLCRDDSGGAKQNEVNVATWSDASLWSAVAPLAGATKASDTVSLSYLNGTTSAAYRGTDGVHYYAVYDGSSWPLSASPITDVGGPITGPTSPAVLSFADQVVLSYHNSTDGNQGYTLFGQTQLNPVWSTPTLDVPSRVNGLSSPAIIRLGGGLYYGFLCTVGTPSPSFACWFLSTDLFWDQSTSPATPQPPDLSKKFAMAPLPADELILVYKDTSNALQYSIRTASGWTPTAAVGAQSISAPSLAPGINGATAELAYVAPDGNAYHQRLVNSVWQAPALLVSGVDRVAIASR